MSGTSPDVRSGTNSEARSAGHSEARSAGHSEAPSAGHSEARSAGHSEAPSAGRSGVRSAGHADAPAAPPPAAPTLCLGEPRVELICERPLEDVAQANAFVPHFGGAAATVAVTAVRHGAHVALAGGAGEDAWGCWLRDRLRGEGVELSRFELIPGSVTPVAVVAVDRAGAASYHTYGEPLTVLAHSFGERVEEAVRTAAGLFIGSATLRAPEEREVTMRARELALGLGRPVVLDASLRLRAWRSRAEAAALNACVPGAMLVRANAAEAELMTGEDDAERAALALLKAGARMVVITLGLGGAILRGQLRVDAPPRPATVLSTIGAGAVLTGVLLARLATSGFYPAAVAASLPEAVAEATLACERWGALE